MWFGGLDPSNVTTVPYSREADLDALRALDIDEWESADVSIWIDGAVVSATRESEGDISNFWLGDANAGIRTYSTPVGALVPGDLVEFTATAVLNYQGELEITGIEDFSVIGSEKVVVVEANGITLTYEEYGGELVHLWGELTADQGDCGGYRCFDLSHEDEVITFRTTDSSYQIGDCVELVAPVTVYTGSAQIDIHQVDWARTFQP